MVERRPARRAPPARALAAGWAAAALVVAVPALADGPLAPAPAPRAALSASPAEPATDPDDLSAALALHDQARTDYEHGRYREAIAALEAALRLDPRAKELVYNLALIHERLGELDQAEKRYREYLAIETDPKLRAQVESVLVRVVGAKAELAAPRAAGPARPVAPPEPPPRAGRSPAPWVVALGGVAAVGAVAGTAFAVGAFAQGDGGHDADAARADAIVSEVCFLTAGFAGGLVLGLTLWPPAAKVAAGKPSIGLVARPAGAALAVRF